VFPDVPLRPTDPGDRADMRAWSKFVDEVLMSSVSMLGWQTRFRPLFRDADPAELERRFARIPLKEMQVKWATTVGPGFSDAELDDSRRKIRLAIERMEAMLAGADWLAGPAYSLADINAYPMIEGAARLYPEAWTAEHAARSMDWLARINARPATQAAFATSRHGNAPGKAADAA
jgi:glutathione S-transferase